MLNIFKNIEDRKEIVILAILVMLAFSIFANAISHSFVWDDSNVVVENSFIRSLKKVPFLFNIEYWKYFNPAQTQGHVDYRPVSMVLNALDYHFWDLDPRGYHLTNILLHVANVILVYYLVCSIMGLAGRDQGKDRSWRGLFTRVAFLTACLYAVHPIHTEAVVWIKNRAELLAGMFMFSSIILFLRHKDAGDRNKVMAVYAGSIVCFVLGILSKETAVMAPFVMVLCAVLFYDMKREYRGVIIKMLPYFLIMSLYAVFKLKVLSLEDVDARKIYLGTYHNALTVVKTLGYYFKLLVFPVNLNVDRMFGIPVSFFESGVVLSFIVLVMTGAVLWMYRRYRLVIFSVMWILITLVPVSNVVFLSGRPVAEQRLYIPSLGYCVLLALGIRWLWDAAGSRVRMRYAVSIVAGALAVGYSLITVNRNLDWKDPISLWSRTIAGSPDGYRAHYNLGCEYFVNGDIEKALDSLNRSIDINPLYWKAYFNTGAVYQMMGDNTMAIRNYKKAIVLKGSDPEPYINLGIIYRHYGQPELAVEYFREAINRDIHAVKAYTNLGNFYFETKEYDMAFQVYNMGLKNNPDNVDILYNMANSYKEMGEKHTAIAYYRRVISLDKRYSGAYNNLALILDDREEAVKLCQKAIKIHPQSSKTYNNMGNLYLMQGQRDKAIEHFNAALKLDPESPEILNNMGRALGNDMSAAEYYHRAIDLKPDFYIACVNLANLYYNNGRSEEAVVILKKAIQIDPEEPAAYNSLGNVYLVEGNNREGIRFFKKAVKADPKYAIGYSNLAVAYFQEKDFDLAVTYCRKAIDLGHTVNPDFFKHLLPHMENRK